MEKLSLYSYYRSSCSYRVRIALYYKNLDFEYKPVHLIKNQGEQFSESYKKLNPLSQVPSLKQGKKLLTQSLPILLYLEELQPEPALLPKDSFQKAEVLSFCEMINSGIQPLQNLSVLNELDARFKADKKEWSKYWIEKGLLACEDFLKKRIFHKKISTLLKTPSNKQTKVIANSEADSKRHSYSYCFFNTLSLADLFLIPQIYNAHRFGVEMQNFPLLEGINKHCLSLEAFQRALPENQPDSP